MALFGSKKIEEVSNEQAGNIKSPVDLVLNMREQGLSNNQIIISLQREGYQTTEIFDAMNQADLQMANGSPTDDSGAAMQNQIYPEELMDEPQQVERQPSYSYQEPSYNNKDVTKIEELVEAVVEEKWVDLVKDVNKIIEWKSKVESDTASINQEIEDLKESFNELQKNIIGKIDEYDKNITKVSTNIKAMENVFQKAIPTFTENINELARTVESLKNISRKRKK
ncbi:MAG: hypothetical protein KKF74_04390 [Nanoarchaeota archaeon]|nr:hypothetical protein [Nanoarchaeota archaeon]